MALSLRGKGYQLKGDYSTAIAIYRDALKLWLSFNIECAVVAIAMNDLAEAEHHSGDFTAAEEHFYGALRVARANGYVEGMATYPGNLAALALDREDWRAAETLAREALHLADAIHRHELIALDNHSLARALVRQGKSTEALRHAQRAVEIYTRLGLPNLAKAQATLAECEVAMADE